MWPCRTGLHWDPALHRTRLVRGRDGGGGSGLPSTTPAPRRFLLSCRRPSVPAPLFFDFNNDGLLDILLLQNGGPNSSAKNLSTSNPGGHFKDVSAGSGLDFAGYNMGVAIGDVNNDGRPDVLITQYSGVKLFLNNGDGTFPTPPGSRVRAFPPGARRRRSSITIATAGSIWWSSCTSITIRPGLPYAERRRRLLLAPTFSGHRQPAVPQPRRPQPDGGVRFEDVTVASGFGRLPGPGLGVVCADFDGDGWPDIFIANDGQPNRLWINQHDGTFTEEAVRRGVAYNGMGEAQAGMGVALGDVDGDGLFDLFVTHLTQETNTLWKQGPRGLFRDETAVRAFGPAAWRGTGFGARPGRLRQRRRLDLAVVNGRVARGDAADNPDLGPSGDLTPSATNCSPTTATAASSDVSTANAAFCQTPRVSRGLAVGDVFNDGTLALLTTEIDGPARLYRNRIPHRGHWLECRVIDPALHRDAYGAEVKVRAGARQWIRWVNAGGSFLCSNDPRVHFGLGQATQVDCIEVHWPDGRRETFDGGPTDLRRQLRRGEGRVTEATP